MSSWTGEVGMVGMEGWALAAPAGEEVAGRQSLPGAGALWKYKQAGARASPLQLCTQASV